MYIRVASLYTVGEEVRGEVRVRDDAQTENSDEIGCEVGQLGVMDLPSL